jgi:hypothetical protein
MAFLPIYALHSNARLEKGCSKIWNQSLTQIKRRIIKTSCRICEDRRILRCRIAVCAMTGTAAEACASGRNVPRPVGLQP